MANRLKKKFKNYMCALVATYKTGIALENFTEHGLQSVHNHIQQTLGNLPACPNQCSQNIRDINRWCMTCTRWRTELVNFLSRGIHNHRIRWQDMKSWCWPNAARDIAEVFLLPGWPTGDINLQDISTIFNVWNRCLQFQRNVVQLLAPLKECRNELIHNTRNMNLTNARTKVVFQNISNVINHPDIRPLIPNHANVTQIVRDLKKGRLFQDDVVSSLRDIGIQNNDIKNILNDLVVKINETKTIDTLIVDMLSGLQKHVARQTFVLTVLVVAIISFLICLSQFLFPVCTMLSYRHFPQTEYLSGQHKSLNNLTSTEGCLSEPTDREFGRISLFEYISHHRGCTGREWLFKQIEMELKSRDVNNRGILLEAGMGYGKSALMKHIICASEQSPAHRLRSRLVAYHVCRFDVLVSKKAFVFVLRLIDMISSQIPILAHDINSCKEIFDRKMCEKDPNGCLDQCIMIPFKTFLHLDSDPVIIAIDGLDECYDRYRDVNEILDLLKQRLYRFPPWVKFLISSRSNQPRLSHLNKDLRRLQLQDESEDNINDITTFLQEFNVNQSALNVTKFASTDLLNFQLVTLLLKDNKTNVGPTFPISLDRYYDEQFNRLFGSGFQEFSEAKQVLEVMCTIFQKSTKYNIWNVLSNTTYISLQQLDKSLRLLDNLIRKIGSELHLIHESLQHWLISRANEDFFVDIENGHRMNALYIFGLIENGIYDIGVVDLAIHVDFSSESSLRQRLANLHEEQVTGLERHSDEYPIVKLAKKADSFIATDILASHFRDVDRRNIDNHTALYIAASLGHVKTFEALVKWNSNITFRTNSYNKIINFEHALIVSVEHMFWDYGILDIAAQNGHGNIVEYVLHNNMILFDYPMTRLNSMLLLPIHLACKKGHLGIVKQLHMRYKWMLDWQCLYYASEIGHLNLVEYILQSNIRDECRICMENIHWLPKRHLRVQGQILYSIKQNYTYGLFDDWYNITCESALHVAVRENKLDVVKLLLSKGINATKCFDRGGRTPPLSAVQYGYKDIVEYFVSCGLLIGSEKCSAIRRLNDTLKLHENEVSKLEQYYCEANMSLAHIVAKYDFLWVREILHEYGADLEWDITDSFGCFPVHKASCHGSINTLNFLLKTSDEDFNHFKCFNGSDPLHSAVACGSVSATEILLLKYANYENEPKEVKMSYINHAILRDNDVVLARDIAELEKNTSVIISMLVTQDSDLRVIDELNRNILHHVIQKGHFYVALHLFIYYPETVKILLKAKDNSNRNPLHYAIHLLETISQFFISPNDFIGKVLAPQLDRMSAKEYSLLETVNYMMQSSKMNIDQLLLKRLVSKQCLNIIVFLLENTDRFSLEKSLIMTVVLESDRHGLQMFACIAVAASRLVPSNVINCRSCHELINRYHLHLIALNYLKISNIVSLLQLNIFHNAILEMFFPKLRASLMSTCYDAKGYNVFERAVQGGSPILVGHLIDIGVSSDLEKKRFVQMALNGLKYRLPDDNYVVRHIFKAGFVRVSFISHERMLQEFGSYGGYTLKASVLLNLLISKNDFAAGGIARNKNNSDLLISELLTEYHNEIRKSDICSPASRQFSVIHRLAFDGLLSSLQLATKYWGKDILHCRTKDGFTPLYMSEVLRNVLTTNYILNQGIKLQTPLRKAEVYFIFKLLFKYFFSRKDEKHMQCIMSHTSVIPKMVYRKIKAYNCARKFVHSGKSKTFTESFNKFKWNLFYFIEMNTWNKITTKFLEGVGIFFPKQDGFSKKRIMKGLTYLRLSEGISNLFNKGTSVITRKYANIIQLIDTERRVCQYLRSPYKNILLDMRRNLKHCTFSCELKGIMMAEIKRRLVNIDLYQWDSDNCTDIFVVDFCLQQSSLMNMHRNLRQAFNELKLELLSMAMKEARYVPFFYQKLDIQEIQHNINVWLRLYNRYDYMNELQTSTTYTESYFHTSKSLEVLIMHMEGVSNTLNFIEWDYNAAEILHSYLKQTGKKYKNKMDLD